MKAIISKVYKMFFVTVCILCATLILNLNHEVHSAEVECLDLTCSGEYVNGFCNTCSTYQKPSLVDNYYLISNAGELYWFMSQLSTNDSINGKLISNIIINEGDVSGSNGNKQSGWRTWYNEDYTYKGTFDGNGFYVSGVYSEFNVFNGSNGFFVKTDGAKILNLSVINSYFKSTSGAYVGGLIGYSKYGSIQNCYFEGTIYVDTSNATYIGGMVGLSGDTTYTDCVIKANVIVKSATTSSRVGGIMGSAYYNGGSYKNCLSDVTFDVSTSVQYIGSLNGNNRSYKHDNTYFNETKYATGLGNTSIEVTPSAISTTEINDGTACEKLGSHKYKVVPESDGHHKVCMTCGDTTAKEDHIAGYVATCKELNICETCGEKYGEYDFSNHVSDEYDENGFAVCCGKGYESIVEVTDSNYAELGLTSDFVGYYAISNAGQLFDYSYKFANDNKNYSNAKLVLVNDIDVNPGYIFNSDGTVTYNGTVVTSGWRHWERIYFDAYYVSENFTGIFNGNYHTIKGLYVNDETIEDVGLFGSISGGEIYNVGIINSYFNANRNVGGIAGRTNFNSVIENCYSEATISSTYGCGGISASGASNSGKPAVTIKNCYFNGVLIPRGSTYMSGIYGSTYVQIIDSYYNSSKCSKGNSKYAKSDEQFKSGEVAYLLNGDQSEIVYGQTIGSEDYPSFGGATVYGGYVDCETTTMSFTNDANHKLNATTGHKWEYSANGNTITATCVQPTCTISDRTETITISVLDNSELTFNNEGKTIKVSESVNGLFSYEVVYTDSENNILSEAPKEIGVYTASITLDTATISVAYEITKSVLESNPSVEVEYGRNHEEVIITSKVYIKDTDYEVEGTWEWITGTKNAKFVPTDTTKHNSIEEINVVIVDISDDPTIELISPITNINPGQSVYLNVTTANKYNNTEVSLPQDFVYTYKIGNSGSTTTFTNGLLSIPNNAPIGSTIYVTVSSVAVANKYNSVSDTIEISVTGTSGSVMIGDNGNWFIDGQDTGRRAEGTIIEIGDNGNWFINGVDTGKKVDYSKDINEINELLSQEINKIQVLIESNSSEIEKINKSIENINALILLAETTAQKANDDLQALLENKLSEAKLALEKAISDLEAKLDQAIVDLEVADQANTEALAQAIIDLTTLIEVAKQAAEVADDKLKKDLIAEIEFLEKELKEKLEVLSKELQDAIEKAVKDNTNLENELTEADKANKEELLAEIKSSIILPIVIGSVSLAGNIALAAYIIIKRRK